MSDRDNTLAGRLREKKQTPSPVELVELPHRRKALIYQRLSTHEQVKKSVYSVAMQDSLADLAKADGYPDSMIIVEKRDLGISGTLGQEDRQGLAHLIELIELDEIECVYVIHISRLFRDQTLIDGFSFGELCKTHNVIIAVSNMRLNLMDKMHMRIYRMELERAADEMELMKLRMGGARALKAKQGRYVSGSVPVGYVVNKDPASGPVDKFLIYEPHAAIIRAIFNMLPEENFSLLRVARRAEREKLRIPFFPAAYEYMKPKSAARSMHKDAEGYRIRAKFIGRIATNPVYIGWWIWGGTLIGKSNHAPIVSEELFWYVQNHVGVNCPKGNAVYSEPLILQGLIYCTKHEAPAQIHVARDNNRYKCARYYNIELDHRYCLSCAAAILDVPITDFVVSQCAFPQYADRIVQQLRQGYDKAKEMAEANKRQLAQLTAEIDKLKENLAYTKTPQQVDVIIGLIDIRIKEREQLTQVKAYPAGRVGDAINIENVTNFLTNIQCSWPSQPDRFKNEFLRIILDRILITAESDRIRARIVWKTGMEQEILIHRAPAPTLVENRWTDQELTILTEHFSTASWSAMMQMLPHRGYFAILEQAQRLKLKRKSGPWSRHAAWSGEEDKLARAVAAGEIGLADVVDQINRTPRAIYARVKELGLSYSKYGGKKGFLDWELVDDGIGHQG